MPITLNGTNQYLKYNAAQIGSLAHNVAHTFCGWFKPVSAATVYGLLHQVNNADESAILSGLETTATAKFRGWFNGSRSDAAGFGSLSAGGWVFVAWRTDGASGNKMAYSGQNGLTSGASFSSISDSSGGTAIFNNFQVGRVGSNGSYFAGDVCCIRIFDSVLTANELYDEAINGTPQKSGCLANWRLEDSTDLTDSVSGLVFSAPNSLSNGGAEPTDIQAGDVVAPVLSSGTATATSGSTATVGVTTDEANGTLYVVVTTSITQPSVAQIKAGNTHTGAAATFDDSVTVSSTGAKSFNATGLTPATTYYAHFVHTDAAANDSNRVTSNSFEPPATIALMGQAIF
jgi:hypothetical protein